MQIRFFETSRGRSPVRRYLDGLDARTLAKIHASLRHLEVLGISKAAVWLKKIDSELWELKSGSQRVIFTLLHDDTLVLLHAFAKQSRRIPLAEFTTARARLSRL